LDPAGTKDRLKFLPDLGGSRIVLVQIRIRFQEPVVGTPETIVALTIVVTTTGGAGIFPVFVLFLFFRIEARGRSEIKPIRILNATHYQKHQTNATLQRRFNPIYDSNI
jgi:hypothetical protein